MQATFNILMNDAGNQSLVRDPLRQCFLLEASEIFRRKPNIDPRIFFKHRFCVFLMTLLYFCGIWCPLESFGVKSFKKFQLFLI